LKPILVIGDSHVRAFAYNANFIPLFIGPAAFNNFLTDKNSDKVLSKILALIEKAVCIDMPILFLFSGDVEHVRRKNQNLNPEAQTELEESAVRYANCVKKISERIGQDVFVGLTLPGRDELYSLFREIHKSKLLSEISDIGSVKPIDFNANISDSSGVLLEEYRADFVHISYNAILPIQLLLAKAGILSDQKSRLGCEFRWWSSINLGTDEGPFKIWGDTDKDELIIDVSEKLVLKHAQRRSKVLSQNFAVIRETYKTEIERSGITIANLKQGQLVIGAIKHFGQGKVNGFEYSEQNRHFANLVGQLFGYRLDDLIFPNPISIPRVNGVVLDLNWWKTKRELQDGFIERIRANIEAVTVIIILSFDVRSDIRLFNKQLHFNTVKLNESSVDSLTLISFEKSNRSILAGLSFFRKYKK